MEPHEYQTLFQFETSYWWYRGLRSILLETLAGLGTHSGSLVLDAGCGTGQNLAAVRDGITPEVFGLDYATEAAPFWPQRSLDRMCRASINEIPFPTGTFDAVMSVDVLECDAVSEEVAYKELWRVAKPGGHLVLVVPAYDWLMSEEHHRAVRASRRYTRNRVRALLNTQPVEVVRVTHLFAPLLPAVAFYRVVWCKLRGSCNGAPRSELKPMNPAVNNLLLSLVNAERLALRMFDIPFGSSILAVARKVT